MQTLDNNSRFDTTGYTLGVLGTALILAWIGVYKFTLTEAKLIQPLVENHFAMGWLYKLFSIQIVSNLIGATEITVAIALLIGIKYQKIAYFSGIAATIIFITTLSFLFTTPNTWKISDGVLVTNFFLLKDILFLAVSISVIERNRPRG